MTPHAHEGIEIDLLTEGAGEMLFGTGDRLRIQTGDVFAVPAHVPHGFIAGDRGCAFQIVRASGLPETVHQRLFPGGRPAVRTVSEEGRRSFSRFVGQVEHELVVGRELVDESVFGIVLQLAVLVVREATPATEARRTTLPGQVLLNQALRFLALSGDATPKVTPLAAALHVSPSYLRQVFREHLGLSPKAYLQQLRHDRAKALLAETDLPLSLVAEHLGYANDRHFSAAFRRAEGVPPASWRGLHRPALAPPGRAAGFGDFDNDAGTLGLEIVPRAPQH
jgi:AraC-like DNA-binding protein